MKYLSIIIVMAAFSCGQASQDPISGKWYSSSELGDMTIEIEKYGDKLHGYLLDYNFAGESIKGAKEEEFVFITDLESKDGQYANGKIYLDPQDKSFCYLSMNSVTTDALQAQYTCDGKVYRTTWTRSKKKNMQIDSMDKDEVESDLKDDAVKKEAQVGQTSSNQVDKLVVNEQQDTKKLKAFKVVGYSRTVKYDDIKSLEKTVEELWKELYNKDFSSKVDLAESDKVYQVYSGYDQAKGQMTITLGYKVKSDKAPAGTNLISIKDGTYYKQALSGQTSDYDGDGWEQVMELMQMRSADAKDFEVYTFDSNYEVKSINMFISAQ